MDAHNRLSRGIAATAGLVFALMVGPVLRAETADSWAAVTVRLEQALAEGQVEGMGLDIYDRRHRMVYSRVFGRFSRTDTHAIGSSSKWITAVVVLSLVDEGLLSLEDTTEKWLHWEGEGGQITLRQLLALTSGFHVPPLSSPPYFWSKETDLKVSVESIYRDFQLFAAPGRMASYGPVGFMIAGRIAEVASGKEWDVLFRERLGDPLGFDRQRVRYDPPQQLAGSLRMSMDDYGRFLQLVTADGVYGGKRWLSAELLAEQRKDQWAEGTRIESSPYSYVQKEFHYGLGVWRECGQPSAVVDCDRELIVSCAGWFGWTPWIDTRRGYYGLLAMEKPMSTRPPGYIYAFRLLEELRPLIVAAVEQDREKP